MNKPKNKPRPRYTEGYWNTCLFCSHAVMYGAHSGYCDFLKRTIKNMDCTRCSAWKEKK